jgi:hypothetical protein
VTAAPLAAAQPVRSLRQVTRAAALRSARTCYDHLAGRLGVQVTQSLIDLGVPADRFADDVPSRRPLLRFCLDWSEQRHHLGGRLGADLLTAFTDAGWVTRAPQHRAVRLTPAGESALRSPLGLDV